MDQNTITLTNDFHGTSVNLRVKGSTLSIHQIRRARRALCGVENCTCGGVAGERGGQWKVEALRDGLSTLYGGQLLDRRYL